MRLTLLVASMGLALASGCAPPAPACIPGKSDLCVGVGGCFGGQTCSADGTRYGPCLCAPVSVFDAGSPTPDAGIDAGVDAGVEPEDAGRVMLSVGPLIPLITYDGGFQFRAYDFELGSVGDQFLLAWIGDGSIFTRRFDATGVALQAETIAPLITTYASSVGVGRLDDGFAAVVGSGSDGLYVRAVDAAGPVGAPLLVSPVMQPSYPAIAWNGADALIAWANYGTLFLRRMRRDGTWLDPSAQMVPFPPSTFVPRVAVSSSGADWLVAISATETLIFQVTAAGVVRQGGQGVPHPGAHLALAPGPNGLLLATSEEVVRVSSAGAVLAGPFPLPRSAPAMSVETIDLARDGRHFLLARTHQFGVDAFLIGDDGRTSVGPVEVDSSPGVGERCTVTAARDGTWLVAWGTATSDGMDAWYSLVRGRIVTVTP